ncbi:MAG TPA: DUF1223 domain-containing protein [Thermoanaerobaculia bacterium]|nr:DUF1223 domain-containing protein [Thermoanaerobaculia bacterium]
MSRWIATAVLLVALAIGFALFARTPDTPALGATPVVVELFTSQGCSSCPPADALLQQLARDPHVIALAFHVDYWDHLGWRDPFSSRDWSVRQGDYVRAMKLSSAYTPQIVVNGSREMVGSNAMAVNRAIAEESRRAETARVSLKREGEAVRVQSTAPREADLFVVLFENAPETKVARGENGGRTLVNANVVRKVVRVANGETVTVPRGMSAVALVQDRATKRILAAAR